MKLRNNFKQVIFEETDLFYKTETFRHKTKFVLDDEKRLKGGNSQTNR